MLPFFQTKTRKYINMEILAEVGHPHPFNNILNLPIYHSIVLFINHNHVIEVPTEIGQRIYTFADNDQTQVREYTNLNITIKPRHGLSCGSLCLFCLSGVSIIQFFVRPFV